MKLERGWNFDPFFFFFFFQKSLFSHFSQNGRRFAQALHRLRLFLGLSPHLQEGSLSPFPLSSFARRFVMLMPFRIFPGCRKPSFCLRFQLYSASVFSSASIKQCLVFWTLHCFYFGNCWCFRFDSFRALFFRGLNVSIGIMRLRGLTLGIAGTGYLANALIQPVLLDTLWDLHFLIFFFIPAYVEWNASLKFWFSLWLDTIVTCGRMVVSVVKLF